MDKTELEEHFCDRRCDICIDCCRGNLPTVFSLIHGKLKSFKDRPAEVQEEALIQVLTSKIGCSE